MKKASGKYVPTEIVQNILSRLRVKDLLRFKCVCKDWYTLITSPCFIKLHLSRSQETNTYLHLLLSHLNGYRQLSFGTTTTKVYTHDRLFYSLDIGSLIDCQLPDKHIKPESYHPLLTTTNKYSVTTLVGSCNGLICLGNYSSGNYFTLYNPSTRTHKAIPTGICEGASTCYSQYYGFGYDSLKEDYNIVKIEQQPNPWTDQLVPSKVTIFSLKKNKWKILPEKSLPDHCFISCHGTYMNNVIHWIYQKVVPYQENSDDLFIYGFNLRTKKFDSIVKLPVSWLDCRNPQLVVARGFLHFMVRIKSNNGVEIWMMKEYGVKDSWIKLAVVDSPLYSHLVWPIANSRTGELILLHGKDKVGWTTGQIYRLPF